MSYKFKKNIPKLLNPFLFILYYLVAVFSKKKNQWVIGSSVGNSFSDNSKYFFLYASTRDEINCYWITRNQEILSLLRKNNLQAYHKYSWKGLWLSLTSSVFIYDSRINGINYWLSKGAFKVALWHGSPLKTIDRMSS